MRLLNRKVGYLRNVELTDHKCVVIVPQEIIPLNLLDEARLHSCQTPFLINHLQNLSDHVVQILNHIHLHCILRLLLDLAQHTLLELLRLGLRLEQADAVEQLRGREERKRLLLEHILELAQ